MEEQKTTGQKTVERLREFTEQIEANCVTEADFRRRIANQTPFQQTINQAINGSL